MNKKYLKRTGISTVESAVVLPFFFVVILSISDLGTLVFRQHVIEHAAAYAARLASVHGENATLTGVWGPTTIDELATSVGVPIVGELQGLLTSCDLNNTRILVEWPGASNAINANIRVTITTSHQHLLALLGGPRTLQAEVSMLIEH